MTNKAIARALKETADLIELTGGNPFRGRAFSNAARTVGRMDESAAERLTAGTLTDVPGIGDGLAAQIGELVERGSFGLRDALLDQIPPGLSDVLRVKGLGAKRVRQLWQELGVDSLDALEEAARIGRLADVSGFGEKTQEKVLRNISVLRKYLGRRLYAVALMDVDPVLRRLRKLDSVERAETSGALRRCMETVDRAEVIAAGIDVDDVRRALAEWLTEAEAPSTDGGGTVLRGALADGLPLEVRLVPPERFGTAWWKATGSADHVAAFEADYGSPEDHSDEADVYAAAGLPWIPPELREETGEMEAAADGRLPDLVTVDDLRGTLHNHSTYSDGADTLAYMAAAARARGLEYFGVCDHSRSLTIAGGLSIDEVARQQQEIHALNEAFAEDGGPPFRILSGIECDVLSDGALDYPDEVLATFDFVVASVHSGFDMTEEEATRRVVRAVQNPFTSILGHATGRLLLSREGYPLDHARVIDACAAHGVAIELNANPRRLDVDWRWLRHATERGVLVSINPDAHSTDQLDNVRWGVAAARKGWLTAEQCLTARSLSALTGWLAARRPDHATP